jgi:hypothetical protein
VPNIAIILVIAAIALVAVSGVFAAGGQFDNMTNFASWTPSVTFKVQTFAEAIARAEGSNPAYNNPGDFTAKAIGWTGPTFGEGIAIFPTPDEGWNRLYFELWLIQTGRSGVYSLDGDTIATMAHKWTATNPDQWAAAVAQYSGLTVDTTLRSALT